MVKVVAGKYKGRNLNTPDVNTKPTKGSVKEAIFSSLSFNIQDKKARHWLVFYDRKTKKPVAKYSIENAKSDLKEIAKEKQAQKKTKK